MRVVNHGAGNGRLVLVVVGGAGNEGFLSFFSSGFWVHFEFRFPFFRFLGPLSLAFLRFLSLGFFSLGFWVQKHAQIW